MKFNFIHNTPKGPYEGVSLSDWQDWHWQVKHALKNVKAFSQVYNLTDEELLGFEKSEGLFQIRTTPYYAVLASHENPLDPLRLIQVPRAIELTNSASEFIPKSQAPSVQHKQEMLDPLAERKNSVTPRLIHRYADRVLFLVTDFCSVYCRFCTRKHFTGHSAALLSEKEYLDSLEYIKSHPGIREVILSGGDPLTLSDEILDRILFDLRKIDHIEIIRLGSRMPVVNPFRLTLDLLKIFKKHKPIYLMTHFNHPREITFEAAEAIERTVDMGVPVFNQMVLLNGVNNHPAIVQALSRRLLYLRVKPYYMFQCDPSFGTNHMRTSISQSLEIQKELWGHLSGLAMPNYSIDIPNGGGKVGMTPNYLTHKSKSNLNFESESASVNEWQFTGFDGVQSSYIDPQPEELLQPVDHEEYAEEWACLKNGKA